MSDLKLFSLQEGQVRELAGSEAAIEKSLQATMEQNLDVLLGVRFLASEYSTGKVHGGRIDTLGVDENGCPVIIEYKRALNENVMNQGLFYLDWLLDHQAEFQLLVEKLYGKELAENIEWGAPRLICIAGGFTKYDEHAVKQIDRNIELIKYTYFEQNLLALDLANATQASSQTIIAKPNAKMRSKIGQYKTFDEYLAQSDQKLKDLYDEFAHFCENLGDDVQTKTLKYYQAFKRIKNFACVEVRPQLGHLLVFLKLDPDKYELADERVRDVRDIGHFGTGDLEVTIRNPDDLRHFGPIIIASYENS